MRDVDLIVVGAGTAGATAGMVAARLGLGVVVVEQRGPGGQIMTASRIENFPGFPEGIGGDELGPRLHEQAEAAGAEVLLDTAEALEVAGDGRILRCASEALRAPAVIVAVGSTLRSLGVPGEERLLGRGVSHCASCDGPSFTGGRVGVVGGGDAALDEALVLAEHAAHVSVFCRGARISAQRALLELAERAVNVDIVLHAVVEEILGEQKVTGVRVRDVRGGATRVETLGGVFVYVGLEPNTAFVRGVVALDSAGHIETDIMMRTSLAGVFAAGDVRKDSVALLAAAAGDGATAAVAAFRYLRRG